ncbi:MAG: hypothetical protein AAB887_00585 [Patescibacteria group bacterium]
MIPLIGAHDFPYLFLDQAAGLFRLPLTWATQSHDSLGVFTLSTLWNWPYGLLYGLAGKIGLNFTLSTLFFGILPVFILGWFTIGKLLKSHSLSSPARFVGQFLFIANTYILMLIDGGQLSLAVAYSFFPLVILYLPSRLNFVLAIIAISFLDIRYLYILFIPIGLKIFFDFRHTFKYLITGLFTGLILIGLHSYWILPSILSKGPSLPSTYTRPAQVDALSFASLSHAFLLIHPHWPKNIFGQVATPSPYFLLLPILTFLPLVVFRKNVTIGYWSTLAIIAAFLVKGSGSPFPQVYSWLFSHIPGFSLFRDPTKFFPLLALSYSVLIAFSADFIYMRRRSWFIFIPLYLTLLLVPIFLGETTGLFSKARNQDSYLKLASFMNNDLSPGSLLWVPSKPPLGYSSPTHPSIDALTLLDKRPFATGVVGSYELLNFLRDATYSGELLNIASIKYLAISSVDPKRDSLKIEDIQYRDIFTKQLTSLPWVSSYQKFGPVTLLQTKIHQPLFFIPSTTTFVVGPDDIYNTEVKLSNKALVFVESQPNLLSQIRQFPQAKILLNHKTNLDAAAALLPRESFLFPSPLLNFSPDSSGWWKREASDLISWRDFLQQKYNLDNQDFDYGGGWSISEGAHTLTVKQSSSCQSDCILLARVMTSPQGGKIHFSNSQQAIGEIDTINSNPSPSTITRKLTGYQDTADQIFTYNRADFLWHEVGQLSDSSPISISTEGNINVVNSLAVIPSRSWEKLKSQAVQLVTIASSPSNDNPQVSYQQLGPAHYRVKVTGLTHPATLAFVQNYDPFWKLSGQTPIPLYGMINGFSIPGAGEYDLIFSPQKYVNFGLAISVTTLLVLLLLLYNGHRKHDSK